MQTVQLTCYDAKGRAVFFTLGMGMTFASALAAARTGMRARMHSETSKAATVRAMNAERI